jgi:UDP-N-acetylmuramate--alanine ligase
MPPASTVNSPTNKENKNMDCKQIKAVYFIGIGGIGMSAIARYFMSRGLVVGGYDKTPTPLTLQLEKEGAVIHYEENVDEIPHTCKKQETCLVVYTPAIPDSHKELQFFRQNNFCIEKRAQVLGTLTRQMRGLCVAGTHGKTTTSTMCAHIMHQSHLDCNAFLGGISKNYGTNYILSANSDYVVIEADEFDRSFHHLSPFMTVITSTDPDHLDIYGTKEAYLESFRHYTELIQPEGALIIHKNLEMKENLVAGVRRYEYSRDEGDFHAENIRIERGTITFDFVSPIECVKNVELGQPIPINIENGVAAMAMAQLAGCTADELRIGMKTYGGVDRRFDFKIKTDRLVLLSDYAHHPKEIYQSARSLRELYKDRHITAIFQPHLYTRTRDFYQDFADALSQLDEVILTEIYPAREQPIEGVTSQLIYDRLRPGIEKQIVSKDQVIDLVKDRSFDVLVILGAGDLDNQVPQIARILQARL